jgi:hypothetical protein
MERGAVRRVTDRMTMKRIFRALAASVLAVVTQAASVSADDLIQAWPTGVWEGGAFQDSTTGEIYCLLWHEYGNFREIEIGVDTHGYYIVLSDPDTFEFTSQEPFGTTLQVDGSAPLAFQAYADSAGTMVVDIATNADFMQQLARGSRLTLPDFGNSFGLEGSGNAVAALQNCYAQSR